MRNRIVLSCEEIYTRVIKKQDAACYYYYTVPFKEKVFFYPLRGFLDDFMGGYVSEIVLVPHVADPERMEMLSYKTYKTRKTDEKFEIESDIW